MATRPAGVVDDPAALGRAGSRGLAWFVATATLIAVAELGEPSLVLFPGVPDAGRWRVFAGQQRGGGAVHAFLERGPASSERLPLGHRSSMAPSLSNVRTPVRTMRRVDAGPDGGHDGGHDAAEPPDRGVRRLRGDLGVARQPLRARSSTGLRVYPLSERKIR